MQKRLMILYIVLFSLFTLSASAQTGLCVNPCAGQFACQQDDQGGIPTTLDQCCNENTLCGANSQGTFLQALGLDGDVDEIRTLAKCNQDFFIEGGAVESEPICNFDDADNRGCCCTRDGEFTVRGACPVDPDLPQSFLPQDDANVDCQGLCAVAEAVPQTGQPDGSCFGQDFDKTVQALEALITPGSTEVELTWDTQCPASEYTIVRSCARPSGVPLPEDLCGPVREFQLFNGETSFVDDDPLLGWGMAYTYEVIPEYNQLTAAAPSYANEAKGEVEVTLGNIECDGHPDSAEQFCVSEIYYDQFRTYLESVKGSEAGANGFVTSRIFSTNNRGFVCVDNILTPSGDECGSGEFCIARNGEALCMTGENCDTPAEPAGLGADEVTCTISSDGTTPRFCYYDKSRANVNGCFDCESNGERVRCSDYRSAGACGLDNCGAGSLEGGACQWVTVNDELGTGVCRNTQEDGCSLCSKTVTSAIENADAYNLIFDACSEGKHQALLAGIPDLACFRDADGNSISCDEVTCSQLSPEQCEDTSAGSCNMNEVCTAVAGNCFKDTDGDGQADCGDFVPFLEDGSPNPDFLACEEDMFSPITDIIAISTNAGNTEGLHVTIRDQRLPGGPVETGKELDTAYFTFFCLGPGCSPDFSRPVPGAGRKTQSQDATGSDAELHFVSNGDTSSLVFFGEEIIGDITDGTHTLRFQSQDPSGNLEAIKEVEVLVLAELLRPTPRINVLEDGPDGQLILARYIDEEDTWFTTSTIPVFNVTFDTPMDVADPNTGEGLTFNLRTSSVDIPVDVISPFAQLGNFRHNIKFEPTQELPEGSYIFSIHGQALQGLRSEQESVRVRVDGAGPRLQMNSVTPQPGSELQEDPVQFVLPYNERVRIIDIQLNLDSFQPDELDSILDQVASADTPLQEHSFAISLGDGPKRLVVTAEDVAGNQRTEEINFIVHNHPAEAFFIFPPFGVAHELTFDLEIGTTSQATCKFSIDRPIHPNFRRDFREQNSFTHTVAYDMQERHVGTEAVFDTIVNGQRRDLFLICEDSFDETRPTLRLEFDDTPPIIQRAEAVPDEVVEYVDFDALQVQTTLFVDTDDTTRCKYSETAGFNFDAEGIEFPGFDEGEFFGSHEFVITLPDFATDYTYFIQCENRALQRTGQVQIDFSVDTLSAFRITEVLSPPHTNVTNGIPLRIRTNKEADCRFDADVENGTTLASSDGLDHGNPTGYNLRGPLQDARHNITYGCTFIGEGSEAFDEISDTEVATLLIDTTEPGIPHVEIEGERESSGFIQHRTTVIEARWLAIDPQNFYHPQGHVDRYEFSVRDTSTNDLLVEPTVSNRVNSTVAITGLNLSDGGTYAVLVKAIDRLGNIQQSLGVANVRIDNDGLPSHCFNQDHDGDEIGIDCGGSCEPCSFGDPIDPCTKDSDCDSALCSQGTCLEVNSTDHCGNRVQDADESDVDCGGSCATCGDDLARAHRRCLESGAAICDISEDQKSVIGDPGTPDEQVFPVTAPLTKDRALSLCQLRGHDVCIVDDDTNEVIGSPGTENEERFSFVDDGNGGGGGCFGDSDCSTGFCDPQSSTCTPHFDTCQNGQVDLGEIGTDCGGVCGNACPVGEGCEQNVDCQSRFCNAFICAEPSCDDGVLDGLETDTDCGGDCVPCPIGFKCSVDTDCLDTSCINGFCGGEQSSTSEATSQEALKSTDSDFDGLTDYDELYVYDTDPNLADTDGDGFSDGQEVLEFFTDPNDSESAPGGSMLSWILLFLSLVIISSGVAYFGYTQYYMPEKGGLNLPLPGFGSKPKPKAPAKPLGKGFPKPGSKPTARKPLFPTAGSKPSSRKPLMPATKKDDKKPVAKAVKKDAASDALAALSEKVDKKKDSKKASKKDDDPFAALDDVDKPKAKKKEEKKDALSELSEHLDDKPKKKKRK